LAVAGSVASLGGLKGAAGGVVKGCLCPDEGDGGIDAGCAPRLSAPRMNFCRGKFGGAGGFTLRVFSATVDVGGGGAAFGALRLLLIAA